MGRAFEYRRAAKEKRWDKMSKLFPKLSKAIRREKALEHLGRAKGALASIKYCFSVSKKISDADKNKVYLQVVDVKKQLITFLYSESNDKKALNDSISKIQDFIILNRDSLGGSLSLRVYRLMRDVIMGIENSISIKVHRTPQSIRAY